MEDLRKVFVLKQLRGPKRADFLLVEIDPPLSGQACGLGNQDIREIVIVPRHEGDSLVSRRQTPIAVHVARPLVPDLANKETISLDELQLIAWADIYGTEEEARGV